MIDTIILLVFVFFTIKGYRIGDTKELIGLCSMFVTFGIAYFPAMGILKDMESVGFPKEFGFLAGFFVSSVLTFPFIYLFVNYWVREIKIGKLPLSKRALGATIGFYKASLIIVLFLYVLIQFPVESGLIDRSYFVSLI
jgi:uncharacterized membrane protein required for colicin V production